MSTTMCPTETQAVQDLREFTIYLDFVDGELMKTVRVIHPDWTPEKLWAAILNKDESLPSDLMDCLKSAHTQGKIQARVRAPGERRSKEVTIAEYWVSDGLLQASGFSATDSEGKEMY